MALFGSKKNTEKKEAKPKAEKKAPAEKAAVPTNSSRDLTSILRNPRITEKATLVSEASNVYVFDVAISASKKDVAEAVKFYYKAAPVKVNIVTVPAKRVFRRGKKGVKSGGKKAYVFLKKGETIEIL